VSPASIDLETAWTVDPRVALRPEPFGALAYHFGTRRLSFLKSLTLFDVVRGLGEHASARDALLAAGVEAGELPRYAGALATLADGGMIRMREGT
jgi:mycofactocin biosynthesis protein MftB